MGPYHASTQNYKKNLIPGSSSADVSGLMEVSLSSAVACGTLNIGGGIPSPFFFRKTRCIVNFFPVLQTYFNLLPIEAIEFQLYWYILILIGVYEMHDQMNSV